MRTKRRSRRSFLVESFAGLNAAWVAANYPGILAAQNFVRKSTDAGQAPRLAVFTDAQALEIEAMTAQIIPTDTTPGAREAHCVHFIDRALSTIAKDKKQAYLDGLDELQKKTRQLYPEAAKFSGLTEDQQIKMLTAMEHTPFFEMVRLHTIVGFLSRPEHGGNYNKVGWKLIGYDDSLNHKPPFGYYDAQVKS